MASLRIRFFLSVSCFLFMEMLSSPIYDQNGVKLMLCRRAVALDSHNKMVTDSQGETHRFNRLLLATGGNPQVLPVPGGDIQGICYYRMLSDYLRMRAESGEGKSATVIGGGFIGSEMAAALRGYSKRIGMIAERHDTLQQTGAAGSCGECFK